VWVASGGRERKTEEETRRGRRGDGGPRRAITQRWKAKVKELKHQTPHEGRERRNSWDKVDRHIPKETEKAHYQKGEAAYQRVCFWLNIKRLQRRKGGNSGGGRGGGGPVKILHAFAGGEKQAPAGKPTPHRAL